jgi:hypothetical protein
MNEMNSREVTLVRLAVLQTVLSPALTAAQTKHPTSASRIPFDPISSYTNAVLFADYSDPDVIGVGDNFYLTASSFNRVPGLPILHSEDLVSWKLIRHAIQELPPRLDAVQHDNHVWAPCLGDGGQADINRLGLGH